MAEHGAPEHLRMDNGPEMIAWALRDWCRLSGTTTTYIEPGAPWANPFVESVDGRFREECLNIEEFGDLPEAQLVVEDWRIEYNTVRPHSALGGLAPAEFAKRWTAETSTNSCSSWSRYWGPLSARQAVLDGSSSQRAVVPIPSLSKLA